MNIAIHVEQVIEIPDEELDQIVRRIVHRFSLDKGSPIADVDLLRQAEALGIINMPRGKWDVVEDEDFEQAELLARAKAAK